MVQSYWKTRNFKFTKFNFAEFYLLISEELLEKSISFARSIIETEDKKDMQENPYYSTSVTHGSMKKEIIYLT